MFAWSLPPCLQVRLVEDDAAFCTLAEVYEASCARYNRETDAPIARFKQSISTAIANQVREGSG